MADDQQNDVTTWDDVRKSRPQFTRARKYILLFLIGITAAFLFWNTGTQSLAQFSSQTSKAQTAKPEIQAHTSAPITAKSGTIIPDYCSLIKTWQASGKTGGAIRAQNCRSLIVK